MISDSSHPDERILVFDFGTSYFKAGVVDAQGQIVALHRQASPVNSAQPGRAEIGIEAFRDAVRRACRELSPHLPAVRAITYSTQANTFTLLDTADRPLLPMIVWNDARAVDLDESVAEFGRRPGYVDATGIPSLNHQFTMAKLKYFFSADPSLLKTARRVSWLPDFFTHWLAGVHATEGSIAALSGLFDVPRWRWLNDACTFSGANAGLFSPVVRAGTDLGVVKAEVATELGLPVDCRVVAGCLDQYAGAIGLGNDRPGRLSETTGTVLATIACWPSWESNRSPQIFRGPGPDDHTFFHMSFGEISANLLEHYQQQLPDRPSFEALSEGVSRFDRLTLNPEAGLDELKSTITSWARPHPRGEVVRAIFCVVAKELARQVRRLAEKDVSSIRSAGGAARSRPWLQIKADVLGVAFVAPATPEPAIVGAASLAAKALGWPRLQAIDAPVDLSRVVEPQKIPC